MTQQCYWHVIIHIGKRKLSAIYILFCLQILRKLLNLDQTQEQRDTRHFSIGPMINITVRRNYLYEDAFEKLSLENGNKIYLIINGIT